MTDNSNKETIIRMFSIDIHPKVRAFFRDYGDDQNEMITFQYNGTGTQMGYKELARKLRGKQATLLSGVKRTKGQTALPGMSIEVILEVLIGGHNFDLHRSKDPAGGSSLSGQPHTISSPTNTTYGAS